MCVCDTRAHQTHKWYIRSFYSVWCERERHVHVKVSCTGNNMIHCLEILKAVYKKQDGRSEKVGERNHMLSHFQAYSIIIYSCRYVLFHFTSPISRPPWRPHIFEQYVIYMYCAEFISTHKIYKHTSINKSQRIIYTLSNIIIAILSLLW